MFHRLLLDADLVNATRIIGLIIATAVLEEKRDKLIGATLKMTRMPRPPLPCVLPAHCLD